MSGNNGQAFAQLLRADVPSQLDGGSGLEQGNSMLRAALLDFQKRQQLADDDAIWELGQLMGLQARLVEEAAARIERAVARLEATRGDGSEPAATGLRAVRAAAAATPAVDRDRAPQPMAATRKTAPPPHLPSLPSAASGAQASERSTRTGLTQPTEVVLPVIAAPPGAAAEGAPSNDLPPWRPPGASSARLGAELVQRLYEGVSQLELANGQLAALLGGSDGNRRAGRASPPAWLQLVQVHAALLGGLAGGALVLLGCWAAAHLPAWLGAASR